VEWEWGFAPTWLRQVSPLLHMTILTTAEGYPVCKNIVVLVNWGRAECSLSEMDAGAYLFFACFHCIMAFHCLVILFIKP